MPLPEQVARERIDEALGPAGWLVQDFGQMNIHAGRGVAVREFPLAPGHGEADYLLYVDGQAVGVVEAKPEGTTLTGVEPQSVRYSQGLPPTLPAPIRPLPFLYESTGAETRFTNGLDPNPRSREVFHFHKPETLARWLAAEAVFLPQIDGKPDPLSQRPATLRTLLQALPTLAEAGLWPAQVKAVQNLEVSLRQDRPRALIQMATGSGKTFAAISSIYRLIKFADASRVLFLVDRDNLGKQAEKEFQQYTTPDDGRKFTELYNVQRLTSNRIAPSARVVITTIQRLYSMLKGEEDLDPALEQGSQFDTLGGLIRQPVPVSYSRVLPIETFDVIFVDECHRSIYSLWRQVLEYFDAFLVGLTATPSKQTFGFFKQNLVMEYAHAHAVADGVNVDYDGYKIRTRVAGRLARIDQLIGDPDRKALADLAGGASIAAIAGGLIEALDPDVQADEARRLAGLPADAMPSEPQLAEAAKALLREAAAPIASSPTFRARLVDVLRSLEQAIDHVSQDEITDARYAPEIKQRIAEQLVQSFEAFLAEHKDEITALQVLYSRPYPRRLRYEDVKSLADAIAAPPRRWTPAVLWGAYEELRKDKVRGASAQRLMTDVVSLVRFALRHDDELVPYADRVHERFEAWLLQQQNLRRSFDAEQRAWLDAIRDHVAANTEVAIDDLGYAPFAAMGGVGKAVKVFGGDELVRLIDELNEALAA